MAKINAVEVHETRHSVELSPDEVRAAIEAYALEASRSKITLPGPRIPGATLKRMAPSMPPWANGAVPAPSGDELMLQYGVVVEWVSCHLPKAAAPSIPPAAPIIGRVYDGSSAGKLEMPVRDEPTPWRGDE